MIFEDLEEYILSHIDEEGDTLAALNRDAHVNLLRPRMLSGHLQGRILKMFCRMLRPKCILEIGTYTAYASLSMAEALDVGAEIHTIEVNDELEDFIRKHINRSVHGSKLHLHIGEAEKIIPQLDMEFDLVFIDADKRSYCSYYTLVFDKLKSGGLIIADNTLWDGKVLLGASSTDQQTMGIKAFNDMLVLDKRIEKVIIPIRDGLTLIWKK
ncbi:O-methyltransferase [Bacteroidales bacterium]|nr:O-methyltransferase [Bacteroidales bacterium]